MKKLILSLLLAGISLVSFAQLPTFGIKGGVNFATTHQSQEGVLFNANPDLLTTFNAGVFADFKFGNISLQPALNLTGKGSRNSIQFTDESGKIVETTSQKLKLFYLQVPVNVIYHIPAIIGDIYLGAGPYVSKAISGKITGPDQNGQSFSTDVKFGNEGIIKSMEYGADAIAGITLKGGLLLNVNYDLGLSNISSHDASGRAQTRVLGISVGYAF